MATALILYSVCASAFVIWCSLRTNLAYKVISDAALNKWKIERPNLIVFDLLTESEEQPVGSVPDALEIRDRELAELLQWIPRKSTVVFCHRLHSHHLDAHAEEALLRAAIDVVYLLEV
jgi:rhodanese-related sulfurtransferase